MTWQNPEQLQSSTQAANQSGLPGVMPKHPDTSGEKGQTVPSHEVIQQPESLRRELMQKKEDLARATEALRNIAYIISHNFRAPLRCMHGYSTLLESTIKGLDSTTKFYTSNIKAAAERMELIVQGLLVYARVCQREYPAIQVDVDQVLRAILAELQSNPAHTRASIHIQEPMPPVWANPSLLELVLRNLLDNALKFVPPGLAAQVQVFAQKREAGRMRLNVEDQGVGLSPELQRHLFGPLHSLLTLSYSGPGMGLLQVQAAAERMNGRMGAESVPTGGSRFWIELPENGPVAS